MKIYGQTLTQIFRRMPWQYQVVTALAVCFIIMTIMYVPYVMILMREVRNMPVVAPARIGSLIKAVGVLDPSLAYDPVNKRVWMAYTAQEGEKDREMMDVRLAFSQAESGCRTWTSNTGPAFEGKQDNILGPDGQTVLKTGAWRAETPSLVYDPDDHGREWKLFAYKYFWTGDPADAMEVAQHYGVITYKYASDPAKGWSTEQWLFSPAPGYPPQPYEQMILLQLSRLDRSLQNIVAFARPSVIYKDGVLVMTLSAFTRGELEPAHEGGSAPAHMDATTPDKIIMIATSDHGNSWRYMGAVLQKSDLAGMAKKGEPPLTQISGASLIEQDGQVYLAAALGTEQQRGAGTFILGFDDFFHGKLRRDPETGKPLILNHISLQKNSGGLGGGAVAYTDACGSKNGVMQSQQVGISPHFQIYQTSFKPIADASK